MAEISMLYVTFPDKNTATEIGRQLLSEKLIACINLFPIQSLYLWNDGIVNDNEYIGLIKTQANLVEQVMARITEIHPYETPCILSTAWDAGLPYFQWLLSVTGK